MPNSTRTSSPDPATEKNAPPDIDIDLEKVPTTGEPVVPQPSTKPTFPETDLDRGIIGWDGQDDPAHPQNFASGRKWALLAVVSTISFISPLASSMFSPALRSLSEDFDEHDQTILSFTVSIFLLGYTFGPLLLAPLSEIYGRRPVLSGANWFFVAWQIGCALAPDIASLIVFRFLAGIGGCGCLTLGAGVIADLFPIEKRGLATSIWSIGPLLGPVVGPIAGGFIGQSLGWRWVYWILLIIGGTFALGVELFIKETYAPVIIRRKTAKLAKELGRNDLRSAYDPEEGISPATILKQGLKRPILLLFKSPIISFLATYMSICYGLLYLFFTTIPSVFENQYGFSPGITGLAYIGLGLGFIFGLVITATTSDKILMKLAARSGGKLEPEMRLPLLVFWAALLPVSFFWYGWSADKQVHWIVPIIGMAPFGLAMMGVWMPIQIYTIDCYPAYAASANAALTASRSLVGALLPLAGPKMFQTLGLGWGNSLLGFVAVSFVPIGMLLTKYGKMIREKYPVKL
ncbi:major facilitator superfamily domain-containing protein [Aspergillus pseudodeflectus]|uniref:Major facilitator superfamily domain-containing protein n=1 Tax=Aspergillus pseudodeflectus TaxID=176178 RepID=A0ABR4JVK6_9EURO